MIAAARSWARTIADGDSRIVAVGFFGSYARGDAGPGSDLDMLIIVERSDESFERRAAAWDATAIPVPVDVLVYTREEYARLIEGETRFSRVLRDDARWLVESFRDGR